MCDYRGKGEVIGEPEIVALEQSLERCAAVFRGITLSLRGCYSTETPNLTAYTEFKKDVLQDVTLLAQALLPLTNVVVVGFGMFFDGYLKLEFRHWAKRSDEFAKQAFEQQMLCQFLADYYRALAAIIAKWRDFAAPVCDPLVVERAIVQKETNILSIRSMVAARVFVPLLFIPVTGDYAAPLVHGGRPNDFKKPDAVTTETLRALTATQAMINTLVPCVDMFIETLGQVEASFDSIGRELTEWTSITPLLPHAVQDRLTRHYEIMRQNACQVQRRCEEYGAAVSLMDADVDSIPFNKERYDIAFNWILELKAPESDVAKYLKDKDIQGNDPLVVDCFWHATANREILQCLAP